MVDGGVKKVKICPYCEKLNDDGAYICTNCKGPLKDLGGDVRRQNSRKKPSKNKNEGFLSRYSVELGYFASIILGWMGLLFIVFNNKTYNLFIWGLVGLIFPLDTLYRGDIRNRKDAYIQIVICLVGIVVQVCYAHFVVHIL